jgi:hypothetical protein
VGEVLGSFATKASIQILSGDFVLPLTSNVQETQNGTPWCVAPERILGDFGLGRGRGGSGGSGFDLLRRRRKAKEKTK